MTYLSRYQQGAYVQVWQDLSKHSWREIEQEPLYGDALAVARETMRRVRYNLHTLIERLPKVGYAFGYGWYRPIRAGDNFATESATFLVFTPPEPGLEARVALLEQHQLKLPLSLRAFYEMVGSVNLVGTPPASWGCHAEELAALQVYPFDDELVQMCLDEAEEEASQPLEEHWIVLSPDDDLKFNYSGLGSYQMRLLEGAVADSEIDLLWSQMSLVEYLRLACAGGGFPGMKDLSKRPEQDLAFLTADLLPF